MSDAPDGHALLDFNAPLSDARAGRLIDSLGLAAGKTVVDYGCGWAELLLRAVARVPGVIGIGVDSDGYAIDRGRAAVSTRGLGDVALVLDDLTTHSAPDADAAISIGSSHAWGGTQSTLSALWTRIRPGGRLLLGDAFWERPPGPVSTQIFGAEIVGPLADLVDAALTTGYRLLNLTTATLDEWDDFESRWCAARERWLLDHPDDPRAAEERRVVDTHREEWLRGYRGELGFAYLTLVRPA